MARVPRLFLMNRPASTRPCQMMVKRLVAVSSWCMAPACRGRVLRARRGEPVRPRASGSTEVAAATNTPEPTPRPHVLGAPLTTSACARFTPRSGPDSHMVGELTAPASP